jgi:TonB family protein
MSTDDERFNALIEKWMAGDFRATDEQALKALTESDPFRREAWQGLLAAPEEDHARQLDALRSRLQEGRPAAPTVPFYRPWAAVAAAVVFLIVGYWWIQSRKIIIPSGQIADKEVAAPTRETDATEGLNTVAAAPEAHRSALPRQQEALKKEQEWSAKPAAPVVSAVADEDVSGASLSSAPAVEEVMAVEADDRAGQEEHAKSKEISKPMATLPPAAPSVAKPQPVVAEDNMAKKSAAHRTKDKANMDSVRSTLQKETLPARSTPTGGWDEWTAYLRQNARLTPEARANNVTGNVIIQFSVNASGDVVNVVYIRRVGYGCDEEALRLIRSWEWTAGRNPVVQVEVPFVR